MPDRLYALAAPTGGAELFGPELHYVGSILDRPEREPRLARKFSTAADAAAYRDARPHLAGCSVVTVTVTPDPEPRS